MIHDVLYGLLLLGGVIASILCTLHIASVKLNPELHSKCHYVWASWCGAALLLSFSAVGRSVQFFWNFTGATEIALCQYCISVSLFGLFATVLWSVALAADRYVAIFHATIYNLPSRLQFYTFSAIMWLLALLLGLMVVPFHKNVPGDTRCIIWFRLTFEAEVAVSVLYIVLSVSTLSLYAVIVYKTQSNVKSLREKRSSSADGKINGHLARQEMRNRRLLATITLVMCLFLISHMVSPVAFIIVGFIDKRALRQETMTILYETLGLLKVLNSIGNLLIFLWRSEDYQTAFRLIVSCRCAQLKAGYNMPTASKSNSRKSNHSHTADIQSQTNSSNRLLIKQPQEPDDSISDTKL